MEIYKAKPPGVITERFGTDRYEREVVALSADGQDVGDAAIAAGHLAAWPHKGRRALSNKPDWCAGIWGDPRIRQVWVEQRWPDQQIVLINIEYSGRWCPGTCFVARPHWRAGYSRPGLKPDSAATGYSRKSAGLLRRASQAGCALATLRAVPPARRPGH